MHTLAALLPDLYGEFFTEIIRGIDLAAHGERYHLLTLGSHDQEAELKALRGRVDGLLLPSSRISMERFDAQRTCGVPSLDNFLGARAMVAHVATERDFTLT